MTKQNRKRAGHRSGALRLPAHPWTGRALFKELRSRLSDNQGSIPTFRRLAAIIGQPTSTTHYWFEIFQHPQLRAFFCLLERLTQAQRQQFIESHCRVFPHLGHPSISQEPGAHRDLSRLLQRKNGLSLLTGTSDRLRTFLFTALGHWVCTSRGPHSVTGIDLHRLDNFVPVESLLYLDSAVGPLELKRLVQDAWPAVATSHAALVLLNGVWWSVPQMRHEILRCSRFKHVILCEERAPEPATVDSTAGLAKAYVANVISVVPGRSNGTGLAFAVRETSFKTPGPAEKSTPATRKTMKPVRRRRLPRRF